MDVVGSTLPYHRSFPTVIWCYRVWHCWTEVLKPEESELQHGEGGLYLDMEER